MNGIPRGIAVTSCFTDCSFMGSTASYAFFNGELLITSMQITSARGCLYSCSSCVPRPDDFAG